MNVKSYISGYTTDKRDDFLCTVVMKNEVMGLEKRERQRVLMEAQDLARSSIERTFQESEWLLVDVCLERDVDGKEIIHWPHSRKT